MKEQEKTTGKIKKRVLFITDNYSEHSWKTFKKLFKNGNYYYDIKSNWLKFDCEMIKDLEQARGIKKGEYDIILIDYGIIGDVKYDTEKEIGNRIKIIEALYKKCAYLLLQGVLAKYYIENDINGYMDRFDILKKLKIVSFGTEDLIYDLYQIIKK